ncbi:MAG: PepSY domain-containing protein [Bacteroidetes bacterium]|nr:PepSY domain-containing protein [Bacteroidota bacterium]
MKSPMKSIGLALACAVAVMISASVPASAQKPKVTMKQARAAAQQAVPDGRIKSAELEHEDGQFIYSFDIKTGSGIKEVWVDAMTGKVTRTENETKADEKNEAQAEKKQRHVKKSR